MGTRQIQQLRGGDLVYLGFRLFVVLRGVVRRKCDLARDLLEGSPRGRASA